MSTLSAWMMLYYFCATALIFTWQCPLQVSKVHEVGQCVLILFVFLVCFTKLWLLLRSINDAQVQEWMCFSSVTCAFTGLSKHEDLCLRPYHGSHGCHDCKYIRKLWRIVPRELCRHCFLFLLFSTTFALSEHGVINSNGFVWTFSLN